MNLIGGSVQRTFFSDMPHSCRQLNFAVTWLLFASQAMSTAVLAISAPKWIPPPPWQESGAWIAHVAIDGARYAAYVSSNVAPRAAQVAGDVARDADRVASKVARCAARIADRHRTSLALSHDAQRAPLAAWTHIASDVPRCASHIRGDRQ